MGHEWITRRAAVELLLGADHDPVVPPDSSDPRRNWTDGLAKNLSLAGAENEVARIKKLTESENRYQSTYRPVYDAIMGERWVDIGGFDIIKAEADKVDPTHKINCWDAAAQEPAEIQEDHSMRRFDDVDGVRAITDSRARFIRYFVEAATAPTTSMLAWDGGALNSTLENVDRNYFLMGRAAHLLQDSFSYEHTVRTEGKYEVVRQVKSYVCAFGSEQHTHSTDAVFDYSSGDVIWIPASKNACCGWPTYKPSNMKTLPLVAMEATKDLWAAFIRTMAVPPDQREAKAKKEAQTIADNWMSFNENEMKTWYDDPKNRSKTYVFKPGQTGDLGQTQTQCMADLKVGTDSQEEWVSLLAKAQTLCLWNMKPNDGYEDLFDPRIHMFYNWTWKGGSWREDVPTGWKWLERPADTGNRVRIALFNSRRAVGAHSKIEAGAYLLAGVEPVVDFIEIGPAEETYFRATSNATLFFGGQNSIDGWGMLHYGVKDAFGRNVVSTKVTLLDSEKQSRSIMNLWWSEYYWVDLDNNVRLTKRGDPKNMDSQWYIEPSPLK